MNTPAPTATPKPTATPAPSAEPAAPVVFADPPHGGRWLRHADGSLTLQHTTAPSAGRASAPAAPVSTDSPEE